MEEEFSKHRVFTTSAGSVVVGGKNAEQNEELVNNYMGKDELIFHTDMAGSPFCVIIGEAQKGDEKEAAVFCAKYSRDWKKNKKDVEVHVFKGKDVSKGAGMKVGTFGVKKFKKIVVKKGEVEKFNGETN